MLSCFSKIPKTKSLLRLSLSSLSSKKQLIQPDNSIEQSNQSNAKVQLMQDKYQKLKMQGLSQRDITGVDSFQRDILAQNKFDLLDPRIKPRVASLSTTMGLQLNQSNQLTEVNLGKIKVKKENEVFLSEVDPKNIPEYYDIVFDYEKQMSLVGKRLQGSESTQAAADGEMNISARRAFQQKSQQEITKEIFGFGFKTDMSFRTEIKKWLMAIFISVVFFQPIISTYAQVDMCLESIFKIEAERMQHLQKFKRQAVVNAIINNPDMRHI